MSKNKNQPKLLCHILLGSRRIASFELDDDRDRCLLVLADTYPDVEFFPEEDEE